MKATSVFGILFLIAVSVSVPDSEAKPNPPRNFHLVGSSQLYELASGNAVIAMTAQVDGQWCGYELIFAYDPAVLTVEAISAPQGYTDVTLDDYGTVTGGIFASLLDYRGTPNPTYPAFKSGVAVAATLVPFSGKIRLTDLTIRVNQTGGQTKLLSRSKFYSCNDSNPRTTVYGEIIIKILP